MLLYSDYCHSWNKSFYWIAYSYSLFGIRDKRSISLKAKRLSFSSLCQMSYLVGSRSVELMQIKLVCFINACPFFCLRIVKSISQWMRSLLFQLLMTRHFQHSCKRNAYRMQLKVTAPSWRYFPELQILHFLR